MAKKVIYFGFKEQLQPVIDQLNAAHGWTPVFLACPPGMKAWAAKQYPHAIYRDEMDLRKAKFDYTGLGAPVPVDAAVLAVLSKYESNCLNLLEDSTGWNFSFEERRRYYYDVLTYWNTMIHRLGPELFVETIWPHTITSFTLYILCKHYGIATLFMDPMPMLNSNVHMIGSTLEDLASPLRDVYLSSETVEAGPETKSYLARVRADRWSTTPQNTSDMAAWEKRKTFQWGAFAKILGYAAAGKAFKESHMAFKNNQFPFEHSASKLTHFDYFWFRDRLRRNDVALADMYLSFCEEPTPNQKYVLFAASQQPEAVTDIGGQVYTDLLLALQVLSASIPSDWVIYYKEHHGNFFPAVKGSLRRNRYYYERIKALGNVRMVSHKLDTFKMIDGAQAVATVCGTSTWEAAVRGKPGLFFGHAWYEGCRSVFRVETLQDCQEAIARITGGYKPDQNDIERYLATIEKVGIKGMNYMDLMKDISKCADPEFELDRLAREFHAAYERFYGARQKELARA